MYSSRTAALPKPPWKKKSGVFIVGIEGIAGSSSRGLEAVGMNVRVILVGRWEDVGLGARQVR